MERADREEEMRVRLSLSGWMWNWFWVSLMSWDGDGVLVVGEWFGEVRAGGKYGYWVFVEEDHGCGCRVRFEVVRVCIRIACRFGCKAQCSRV